MLASKPESSGNPIQYCFRAALAEARLMTAKQASDQAHFLALAEELHSIEQSIASLEHDQRISRQQSCREGDAYPAAWQWMREKSAELDRRLRQIESNSPSDQQSQSISTTRNAYSRRTTRGPRIARPGRQAACSGSMQQKKRA
jgi:hypothetical protein